MARVTVEDCLKKIPNRFELVLCAAYRARQISQGYAPKVDAKDKPTVVALREIAEGKTGKEMLEKVPRKDASQSVYGSCSKKGTGPF